jgi:AcrR family transcriptional regulator
MAKKTRTKKTQSPEDSKERLLRAAREIFAQKGYNGTSTRDIAREAGVNISLISYHFNGKEGLYNACIEDASRDGLATVERVLKRPESVDDFKARLKIFIEEFILLHLKNRETTCIILRELANKETNPVVLELFKNKFSMMNRKFVEFLSFAQKQKYLDSSIDVEVTAALVMSFIAELVRTDRLRKLVLGKPGFLEPGQLDKTITQVSKHILYGVLAEK